MSLLYELEPKVKEIERLALEWYTEFLTINKFRFENGNVVVDPSQLQEPTWGVPPASREERERPMRENWNIFNSNLTALKERFQAFYDLDPLDHTILVGKLGGTQRVAPPEGLPTSVYDRIGYADQTWVSRVDGMLAEKQWSGPAAGTFHEQFLFKFHQAAAQQQSYAQLLGVTAQAYHEAVTNAIKTLHRIADTCLARLNGDYGTPGYADLMESLSLTSIFTGALAFFPPIAVPAGIASLSTSILGYAGGKNAPDNPAEIKEIEGYAAPEIIVSTHDAIITVEVALDRLDTTLAGCLDKDMSDPTSLGSPGLRLSRPELADDRSRMGALKIRGEPGVAAGEDPVVVSMVDLYRAGFVNLPGAAGQYLEAENKLASAEPSMATRRYFQRSVPRFNEARALLGGVLHQTADSLTAAGKSLVACANEYQLTDAAKAEYLRQIGGFETPLAVAPPTPRHGPL